MTETENPVSRVFFDFPKTFHGAAVTARRLRSFEETLFRVRARSRDRESHDDESRTRRCGAVRGMMIKKKIRRREKTRESRDRRPKTRVSRTRGRVAFVAEDVANVRARVLRES